MKRFMARLRTLEKMERASRERDGLRLSPAMEKTLLEASRRGDIIRSIEHAVGERLSLPTLRDYSGETAPSRLIGRVIGSGAVDDAHEKRFLGVDGADGHQWHVEVDLKPGAMPPEGAVIEVTKGEDAPKNSDVPIAERHGGVYSDALHAAADHNASAEYRRSQKRRLEASRRAGIVNRESDDSWSVPGNYLQRAAAFERRKPAAAERCRG